jgi:hypothetical protein
MSISYALRVEPDWIGEKSIAIDVDVIPEKRSERFFFPRSQIIHQDGHAFIPQWLIEAKRSDAIAKGYDFTDINKGLSEVLDWKNSIGQKDEPKENTVVRVPELIEAFDRAAENLKWPKIKIEKEGRLVRIARQGSRSNNEGGLKIDNGCQYGDPSQAYYGNVTPDGVFHYRNNCPADVIELVCGLNSNLGDTASVHGLAFGNCCFCSRELTDPKSVRVGYGPVCADHYGLPHGAKEVPHD